MCGVVEVWASKGRHGENSFCSGDLRGGGEGSSGSTGFLSSFSTWSSFGEAVVFFLCLEMDLSESPRGRNLLVGVKHWFYAIA